MPTNLPPKAKVLMREYQEASSLEERIERLQALISAIPEHKGTEKLRRQLRRTLSKLRLEFEEKRRRKAKSSGKGFAVKKEGAGQIVIVGDTMSGKSSFLSILTNAKPEIGHSPCTTRIPIPGMMNYKGAQIQLVEAPSIFLGAPWLLSVLSLCRNADALILLIDLSRDWNSQLKFIIESLRRVNITLRKPKVRVEIERRSSGGIQVFCSGRFLNCSLNDIVDLIRDYGFNNAVVRIWGDVKLEDVEKYVALNLTYKPSIIIANKCDLRGSGEKFKRLKETLNGIIKVLPFSCIYYEKYVKYVKKEIFDLLGVIRVFTKEVGGEIAEKPLIVPKGTRVIDVARMIHSRLYREFKYAKVWGVSVRFNGQRVGADHVLSDGDIVEIRTK